MSEENVDFYILNDVKPGKATSSILCSLSYNFLLVEVLQLACDWFSSSGPGFGRVVSLVLAICGPPHGAEIK